ncbi:ABC transporter ATP-binding protein [Actinocorallia sp. A-T 12471]|uniref:ABC transporter ATP-binding protein n=1 Tax=Actinocorallia sp. A-T 12471 TaxID=3089813 RepID=UPI0029D35FE9|nr:ABC transporter ATP-binding protein [Actinocorallia sp. A-T 12471]MDX6739648.1 ABC transporter ATP-binding protein [Actinocorallia sp. A-T 12471]
MARSEPSLLEVSGLHAGYGPKRIVHDLELSVAPGEVVGLFGHNGAGKTTVIRTVLGLLPAQGGRVAFAGRDATGRSARANVRAGMALIPSERFVFPDLSIADHLRLGAANAPRGMDTAARLDLVRELFPLLAERPGQLAGRLSGGQQRMVSLGMALMAGPRLLLLDEPSLGLAPGVVQQIFDAVRALADREGPGVLLLEQNVAQALRICDRVCVLRSGRLLLAETAEEMRARESYWDLF